VSERVAGVAHRGAKIVSWLPIVAEEKKFLALGYQAL
jgi:hypothetical protein